MTERRAPVQGEWQRRRPAGTIVWAERVEAWKVYVKRYLNDQTAERIAERGGFGYLELTKLLGREPATWEAKPRSSATDGTWQRRVFRQVARTWVGGGYT